MAASIALANSCAVCNFGAIASSILSYSAQVVETITVSITPHVTVFSDGHRTTSYESHTLSEAIVLNTGSTGTTLAATTYTDEADITWTVGDATLTYPTSYVHYLGFAGVPATTDNGQTCAVQTTTSLMLPTSTDAADFIFPLGNVTAAIPLPSALLEYLDGLDIVSSQYHGKPLTACAPLVTPRLLTVEPYTIPTVHKRFEGPRRTSAQQPIMTPAPQAINGTLYKRRYGSGTGVGTGGTGISGGSAGSTSSSAALISYKSKPSSTEAMSMSESEFPAGTSEAGTTAAELTIIASAASSVVPMTNVHTTAFVITAITGRAVTTTESAPSPAVPALNSPSPSPSPSPNVDGAPSAGGDSSSGGDSASSSGSGNSGNGQTGDEGSGQSSSGSGQVVSPVADNVPTSTTPSSGPDLSNLIGQVESVARASATQTTRISAPDSTGVSAAAVSQAVVTVGSQTFTIVQSGGSVVLNGASSTATVNSKSVATFAGQTVSLLPGGSAYAVNGQTFSAAAVVPALTPGHQAVVTGSGYTYTASVIGSSVVLANGLSTATVQNGAVLTFGGQTLSIAAGSIVVDGSSTVELSEIPSSSTTGLGDYIHSGLNAATTTSARTSGTTSSASANASVSIGVDVSSGSRIQLSLAVCACLVGWVLVVQLIL